MTLPPLVPRALHAHLDLCPGSQSICPILQVHFGVRTGKEPRDLSGALVGKLEKLPSDVQMPQDGSQTSGGECGALLWVGAQLPHQEDYLRSMGPRVLRDTVKGAALCVVLTLAN